jgi:hypothetical protein
MVPGAELPRRHPLLLLHHLPCLLPDLPASVYLLRIRARRELKIPGNLDIPFDETTLETINKFSHKRDVVNRNFNPLLASRHIFETGFLLDQKRIVWVCGL